jgi:hypothetical protein
VRARLRYRKETKVTKFHSGDGDTEIFVFLVLFSSIFLHQTEGNEGNKGSLEEATPVENLRSLGYLLFNFP